jgi:hypothetical protein
MAAAAPAAQYPYSNVRDPYRPLTESQRYQPVYPTDPWTNQYALTIVNDSVQQMEMFLQTAGHYNRWVEADKMFVGWRPRQNWEGSRRPKASIPVMLLFSQIMSLLPNVLSAMFPIHENIDIAPRPYSTPENAQAAWDLIMAQLDSLGESGIKRFRLIADQAFQQAFLYGNGVVEISWLYKEIERLCFDVDWVAPRRRVWDNITGQYIMTNVGEPKRTVKERIEKYVLNQPNIECVDIRDFLIDPHCPTPFCQDARFAARRHAMTVGDIISYRGQPGFDIPDDYILIKMAESRPYTQGDTSKAQSASIQSRQWDVYNDYTNDPYMKRLEVIRWFNKERHVWTLNRTWCAFNKANSFKLLPFLNAFYVPFQGRWHGLALADVSEGEQRLQASLIEARLNDLAMRLSAPFVRKTGTMVGASGTIPLSPTKVIDVNDEPAKAIQRLEIDGNTQEVHLEVNESERRAAKTTGLSDMAVMGVATAGGNSAQRTAEGVDALKSAAGKRIQWLIENGESSFIEPLCTVMHAYNVLFLPRDQMIQIIGVDGKQKQVDPVQVLNAMPRFTMRAASRMRQRSALMPILPWLTQTYLSPQVMELAAKQQNKVLDVIKFTDWIMDVVNAPKVALWRDMTAQEQQQMQQPPPEVQAEMQKQQMRLAQAIKVAAMKGDVQLLNTLISKLITPRAAEDFLGFSDVPHMQAMQQGHFAPLLSGLHLPEPAGVGGTTGM